jgi:hypothetical protein
LVRIGVSDNGGSFRCCVTRDLLFVFIDHLLVLLIFLPMLLSMVMKYDRYRYTWEKCTKYGNAYARYTMRSTRNPVNTTLVSQDIYFSYKVCELSFLGKWRLPYL